MQLQDTDLIICAMTCFIIIIIFFSVCLNQKINDLQYDINKIKDLMEKI